MTERDFIKWLMAKYADKRSDICELCDEYLKTGQQPVKTRIEHRIIQATIPGTEIEVEYDTLTTEMQCVLHVGAQWESCTNHKYLDE